jgi:acylphosphatase
MATRIIFSGRVQGVGLRAHIEYAARKLKLSGYVKNLEGDLVEAVVEGSEDAINHLIEDVKRYTFINGVEKTRVEGEFSGFRITY